MKIVLTGGGTAGHVTPNLALLPRLRELGVDIHYIGRFSGIERELAEREGVTYHGIRAGKLRRYQDVRNVTDMLNVSAGLIQALAVLAQIRPNLVFSKGGFVSCPVVWAAWASRIPVVLHESDMTPGLANRLSIPFARKICVAFPETLEHIRNGKGILTGIPIRESLYSGSAAKGREICRFTDDLPVAMVIGGSQGSEVINAIVRSAVRTLTRDFQVCHLCGKGGTDPGLDSVPRYKQFEYANEELPHLYAMSDVTISRSGATTLFEILALRKPSLLIPLSKRVSRGDQILNARSFEDRGFSRILPEEDLSDEALLDHLREVYANRSAYIKAMTGASSRAAVDEVIRVIVEQAA